MNSTTSQAHNKKRSQNRNHNHRTKKLMWCSKDPSGALQPYPRNPVKTFSSGKDAREWLQDNARAKHSYMLIDVITTITTERGIVLRDDTP